MRSEAAFISIVNRTWMGFGTEKDIQCVSGGLVLAAPFCRVYVSCAFICAFCPKENDHPRQMYHRGGRACKEMRYASLKQ